MLQPRGKALVRGIDVECASVRCAGAEILSDAQLSGAPAVRHGGAFPEQRCAKRVRGQPGRSDVLEWER